MFTGLIQEVGTIKAITTNTTGKLFAIESLKLIKKLALGDSVAINGVCLTVSKLNKETFEAQAVHITLAKTNIGLLNIGKQVNLELALKASDRLGGHFVQGHVNGIATIETITHQGNNYEITICMPTALQKYMIAEGSIALDGISLTIASCSSSGCTVSVIPHTWLATTLHDRKIGDKVNIEIDIIAKYVEKFVHKGATDTTIEQWLHKQL